MSLEKLPVFLLNFSVAEMGREERPSYRFERSRLDLAECHLTDNDKLIPLTPKALDVPAFQMERVVHPVEIDGLVPSLWSDIIVEEANLARIVHTLLKTSGEDNNGNKNKQMVANKGRRFVAAAAVESNENRNIDSPRK